MTEHKALPRLLFIAMVASLGIFACREPAPTGLSVPDGNMVRYGKGGGSGDPTVNSAVPDTASQGTTLDVEIGGSGFDEGTTVEFAIAGVTTADIQVNSTQFVNPRRLRSNVTVADDAEVTLYDIVVMTARGRPGIGTELFQVKPGNDPNFPALEVTIYDTHPVDGPTNLRSDGLGMYVDGVCGVSGGYGFPEPDNPMLGFSLWDRGPCVRTADLVLTRRHVEGSDPDDHSGDFDASLTLPMGIIKVRPKTVDAEHPSGRGSLGGYCTPNLNRKNVSWPFRFNPYWHGGETEPLYPFSDVLDVTETDWRDPLTRRDPIAWTVSSKPNGENVIGCIRGEEIEYWHWVVYWEARVPVL